jgi:hypothetical protein
VTTSDNEFAAFLGEVFDNSTAKNLKAPADDKQETCPCKKKLKALSKKLKLSAIYNQFGKRCGK